MQIQNLSRVHFQYQKIIPPTPGETLPDQK